METPPSVTAGLRRGARHIHCADRSRGDQSRPAEAAQVYSATQRARAGAGKDAEEQVRQLKREHRALYAADPRRFRRIVRLAQSAVFRQKPGPKPDRQAAGRIARAARRRAKGAKWAELYPVFIAGYQELNPVTRAYAEDGFRRKVNKYRQSHWRVSQPPHPARSIRLL